MWCQPRVPKASRVFGSRCCYPALGQIPGESFCLGMLSPCLAPVCRGIYFRVKKRETNKGALKIIEVGEGGVLLPFQERKTNPRGFTSERLPARGSKVRAGGEAESAGRGRCGGAGAVLSRQVGPCRGPHFQEPSATQRRGRAGGTGGSPPRGGGPGGPGPPLPPGGTAAPRATPTEGAACEGLR